MALFGKYDMPLWYKTGAKAEHLAVIQAAGIFDTSHMAAVSVKGEGARALLQHCLSKDLNRCLGQKKSQLVDGRCVYGVFLNADGTVIDDAIVYQLQPSVDHLPVQRFLPPEEFTELEKEALALGFSGVASGPFVRSSYQAERLYRQALMRIQRT